jgi:acyloxyacyl hydrolase
MHRDYVNAGVNGASVDNLIDDGPIVPSNYTGAMQALPSRYKVDGPSTVFFSMIGNDICHAKELGGWTPTDVFASKAQEEFEYLDTILAPNSHVIIMGLVDGRVLYETLKDAYHPAGSTYPQFYDYLNCMNTSPCWGWSVTM